MIRTLLFGALVSAFFVGAAQAGGRVPPNLKTAEPAPAAPELLLVATASRSGDVTVMTAKLIDRTNLKIVGTAEVRGRGKAGDPLDFPADVVAQLTGKAN